MNAFKAHDWVEIHMNSMWPNAEHFNGRVGFIDQINGQDIRGTQYYVMIGTEGNALGIWLYENELRLAPPSKKKEETPMKEKATLKADVPMSNRAFSAEFLTQLGWLVNDVGAAVDTFNGNDDLVSAIKAVNITISTAQGDAEYDLKVSLDSAVANGKTVYAAVLTGKGL